jgi:hypothetical protein
MSDDKSKRGAADRRTVAGGEAHEVECFTRKHGITMEQARISSPSNGCVRG